MPAKRKLSTRSYDEKYEIIKFVDENPNMKRKDVALKFNLKPNTPSDILKCKEKIIEAVETPKDARKGNLKRRKTITFDDVDAALLLWFRQKESQPDLRLDGEMLLTKAKHFAEQFGHDAPLTMSWVERFKKRHGIGRISKAGEAAGVNEKLVSEWKEGGLKDILTRFAPADIYNADETGIFWQMLPEKSLGFTGTSYHGSKQSKTRITALVCANMDGSDKMPLLVIGKSKRPRAFKNVKTLPVEYEANKKAWMNSSLFESWLRKLDKMGRQSRKIAMVVDNCPAHPNITLENIELVFLPPNTTSVTQPMDGGIIRNLKLHYRHILASRRLAAAEMNPPFKWDLLDAILALKAAWAKVTPATIANIYQSVGFVRLDVEDGDQVSDDEAPHERAHEDPAHEAPHEATHEDPAHEAPIPFPIHVRLTGSSGTSWIA
ncbi:tigger transposable element-derived protein 4-like [Lytechinus variegatus]|uniref:tigger transposable element-derived protein 4-like n=1 Tax=Lytechinus variegatus TaxID=7654 RepID=UPI001BB102E5|nr:tigger transposable element-derived protein 4-like [Lytechinus variegatus]